MSQIVTDNYVFDASAQTVTLSDYVSPLLARLMLIVNVTDQIILYRWNKITSGATLAGNVFTLEFDTTAMDDTDKLMIIYDDAAYDFDVSALATEATVAAGFSAVTSLLGTANTFLSSIDATLTQIETYEAAQANWDESGRVKVNPIVGQAGVAAGAGAVAATVQRVTLASDDPAVVSLAVMDDWDESDRAKVNLIAGQAGITGAAGAVAANTPRITHASDDPVTVSVQLIDDIVVAQGTALGTTKNALIAGSVTTAAPTYVTGNINPLSLTTGGALRVDASAATITIGGSVTANAGTNLNTSLLALESGGNLASIVTSVQLIDDTVYTDDTSTHSTGVSKGILLMAAATPTDTSVNANDIGAVAMTTDRQLNVRATVASGGIASGAVASGAIASGAVASGAFASGALASGSIAVGAIAAGDTSIATTEDTARAAGEHLVKVGLSRLDTPVANANVSNDGDYTNFTADNFGKLWVAGTVPEDTAHVAGEALTVMGMRRINTLANSAGSDADWGTANQTAEGAAWATLGPTAETGAANGLSIANFTSGDTYTALTNSAQAIKASAGNLYGYYIFNPNTSTAYVMVYNIAAASVTVGTSTAALVFAIPAGAAANLTFPYPIPFSNAGWSAAAATTGNGNSAPSTALEAMFFYK